MSDPTRHGPRKGVEIEGSLLIEGDGFTAKVSGSENLIYLELPSFGSLLKLVKLGSLRQFVRFSVGSLSPSIPLAAELRVQNRTLACGFLTSGGIIAKPTPIRFFTG